jgi:formate dehydrogenase iron-sulfur subunit
MPKFFLIDTTRCIACRGCQIACKAWNKLPAGKTRQTGTYENPPDLDAHTYRIVRFREYPDEKNSVKWYFFPEACRHCIDPPCKEVADEYVKDAVIVDKNGAVIFTEKTKLLGKNAEDVIAECPYNIPRLDIETGRLTKCHMCHTRIRQGLEPACVKACSTGALVFGNEMQIKSLSEKRLDQARKKFGNKAQLINPDEVRAIYLIVDEPEKYYEFATY